MSAKFNKQTAWGRAALNVLAACALLAALACGAPARALADEPSDGENAVNPQQLPDSSFIYDTSIADLGSADAYFDDQTVQVTGEVVGDSLRAGLDSRHRWITLASDGGAATISVYMTNESAAKVDTFGSYDTVGTTLQVQGTFHLVCTEHEGISDLHAAIVTVVEPGKRVEDEFDPLAFVPGLLAVAVGLVMIGVFYWMRERQR